MNGHSYKKGCRAAALQNAPQGLSKHILHLQLIMNVHVRSNWSWWM